MAAEEEYSVKEWEELQKWEGVDVTGLAVAKATRLVERHPVLFSVWAAGLLLAAFAGGLPVSEASREAYSYMRQQAEVVDSRERDRSLAEWERLQQDYYSARGWFGACDERCARAYDRAQMARADVARATERRDGLLAEGRREVGIWSTFGVQDVRDCFWSAWKAGKAFAARMTMYDALLAVGGRDESLASLALRLVLQYVVNLTMGLVGAFFIFVYNVYCLVLSYGSAALSGAAFLLLAVVAGLAVLGGYLASVYGVVAGGGLLLMQQAARHAAIQSDQRAKARGVLHDGPPRGRKKGHKCPV